MNYFRGGGKKGEYMDDVHCHQAAAHPVAQKITEKNIGGGKERRRREIHSVNRWPGGRKSSRKGKASRRKKKHPHLRPR